MKFLFGLMFGVALGVVFAPAPGEQTRANLAEKTREVEEASERKLELVAGDVGSRVGRQAGEAAVAAVAQELLPNQGERGGKR